MEEILRINDLKFRWPKSQRNVLDIQSLSVNAGERMFIKGESGSGKTTLLSLVGGINSPDAGSIEILNQNLSEMRSSARDQFRADHIGFIFQLFNLIPYLSVIENIVLSCQFSRFRMKRALDKSATVEQEALRLLNHLQIKDPALIAKPVVELSVGQQQRVAAARALVGAPELIIADEPTSALDSSAREYFLDLLFRECEQCGSTVLFVSHDSTLETQFDRTLLLHELNRASVAEVAHKGGL